MKLQMVQNALKQKNIKYEYTEEDDCGSLDFMFRGLRFHVWEYHDEVWGAETNIYEACRESGMIPAAFISCKNPPKRSRTDEVSERGAVVKKAMLRCPCSRR